MSRLILLAVIFCSASPGTAQTKPGIENEPTWRRSLTSGNGFAQAFPGDVGIGAHKSVIFAEQFEDRAYVDRWDSARNRDTVLSLVDADDSTGRLGAKSLQVRTDLEHNTGGGVTKWFESNDVIFIRFYCRFAADCDYVHHFCTLRANKSLQGKDRWSGFGGAGELPDGDERFSTALEPWGNWGKWSPPGRWGFYSYWHEMAQSRDGKYWGNGFRPDEQVDILRGQWICAEFMLRHNTAGVRDGEQAFWIDGELRGHWKQIAWRTSETLWANAFTLEAYVTDNWTEQRHNTVQFDNVVIASEYIGPSAPRVMVDKPSGPAPRTDKR